MKVRTVVEVTLTDLDADEIRPVVCQSMNQFRTEILRMKFYQDGRWYVIAEGPMIKLNGTLGRTNLKRDWTGSDTSPLPDWIADLMAIHGPTIPDRSPRMSTFKFGDIVRYKPQPGEDPHGRWHDRAEEYDSIIVDLPGDGRPAYGMAAMGDVDDRWFAIPESLTHARKATP